MKYFMEEVTGLPRVGERWFKIEELKEMNVGNFSKTQLWAL